MHIIKRPLPPFYFITGILLIWPLDRYLPAREIITYPYYYIGIVIVFAGGFLGVLPSWKIQRVKTTIKPYGEASQLVTSGFYRFTRNPMYLGIVTVLLGWAILLGSLTPLIVPPVVFLILDRTWIQREERSLKEIFGQEYADYCKQVRRWI